ncbi:rho-related protein racD-like [Babylonia areolata]|uniref:rho-related protein racD-like n=1 Tax=Babylonia areolata TaxID=304850 RepID=UPI003FD4010B
MAQKTVKCVLVGDGAVGKMTMASTFDTGQFPEEWVPTVVENRTKQVTIGQEQVSLDLWITCGLTGFERTRHLTYPGTDIFIVCFSLLSRESMASVSSQWIYEIRHFCPHVPFMIVGTKMDLRTDEQEMQRLWEKHQQKPITTAEGEQLAASMGAECYMECSAKSGENLNQTMEQAVRLALTKRKPRKKYPTNVCRLM